jgi:hypothetical protein
MSKEAPKRMDMSDIEIVGNLDMIGDIVCQMTEGKHIQPKFVDAAIHLLRLVRDDLAARAGLGVDPLYNTPAFVAELEMRDLVESGIIGPHERNEKGA